MCGRKRALCLWSGLFLLVATGAAFAEVVPVADFDRTTRTTQGGLFRCCGGAPSGVADRLLEAGQPAAGAWRIDVAAGAADVGVGGIIPLYDNRSGAGQAPLLDASRVTHLHARLIGALGQRRLNVDLVAGRAIDPPAAGAPVASVTAEALDARGWRTVSFALPTSGLDRSAVGAVRLMLEGQGPAWIAVDWLAFSSEPSPPAVESRRQAAPRPLRQAMWVWKTKELVADPAEGERCIAVCQRAGVTDMFLQLPYRAVDDNIEFIDPVGQRRLIAAATKAGMRVHALDGDCHFVLRPKHDRMFRLVDALAEFNRAGPPEARYHGLHLDNEPYVLPDWKKDAATRQEVIDQFLELNRELSRRAKAAGLEFGLDIPFWWDKLGDDGQPAFRVRTAAGETTLLEAVFPLVQNMVIMSFRERATGSNGIIGVASNELALGARLGVEVLVAVELGTGPNVEKGITFGVYPPEYFFGQLDTLRRVLPYEEKCAGVAIHAYQYYREFEGQKP